MTFGVQNSDEDAFEQLDYAMSRGCNFIDTAELYPVPLTSPDYRAGATEEILGRYIAKNMNGGKRREDLIIASKIAGFFPSSPVAAARSYPNEPISPPPDCRLDSSSIRNAVEASMRRLNTDYIDLYQIHWPDRYVPAFGMTTFQHTQVRDDDISILETASALKDMIDEGKIRYIGLSNESTFGVCQWINACEQLGIRDKLATIQNSYNLLDRRFDSELAEACHHYDIGLLPWSVLAGGLLSGKYNKRTMGDNVIKSTSNSRFVKFPGK
jgi:aryl-alcohol dehydrogenase-like predicted oxidoreductase